MPVKINMEMPTSCAKCKFGRLERDPDNPRWFCISEYKYYRIFPTKRPSWCPLQEVKE